MASDPRSEALFFHRAARLELQQKKSRISYRESGKARKKQYFPNLLRFWDHVSGQFMEKI